MIHPLVLGSGQRLFDHDDHVANLRLLNTIPTTTGPATDHAATQRLAGPGLWRPDLTAAAAGT